MASEGGWQLTSAPASASFYYGSVRRRPGVCVCARARVRARVPARAVRLPPHGGEAAAEYCYDAVKG